MFLSKAEATVLAAWAAAPPPRPPPTRVSGAIAACVCSLDCSWRPSMEAFRCVGFSA